jgi:hypothetical protein
MQVDMPMLFAGSQEQRIANRESHQYDYEYARCIHCDCRPWGRIAEWACGAEVPRVIEER